MLVSSRAQPNLTVKPISWKIRRSKSAWHVSRHVLLAIWTGVAEQVAERWPIEEANSSKHSDLELVGRYVVVVFFSIFSCARHLRGAEAVSCTRVTKTLWWNLAIALLVVINIKNRFLLPSTRTFILFCDHCVMHCLVAFQSGCRGLDKPIQTMKQRINTVMFSEQGLGKSQILRHGP